MKEESERSREKTTPPTVSYAQVEEAERQRRKEDLE